MKTDELASCFFAFFFFFNRETRWRRDLTFIQVPHGNVNYRVIEKEMRDHLAAKSIKLLIGTSPRLLTFLKADKFIGSYFPTRIRIPTYTVCRRKF